MSSKLSQLAAIAARNDLSVSARLLALVIAEREERRTSAYRLRHERVTGYTKDGDA